MSIQSLTQEQIESLQFSIGDLITDYVQWGPLPYSSFHEQGFQEDSVQQAASAIIRDLIQREIISIQEQS